MVMTMIMTMIRFCFCLWSIFAQRFLLRKAGGMFDFCVPVFGSILMQ
jgi:hypothetical protein